MDERGRAALRLSSPGSTHECCGRVQSVRPFQRAAGICAASERDVFASDTTLRPANTEHAIAAPTLQRRDAQQWRAEPVAARTVLPSARVCVSDRRSDPAWREHAAPAGPDPGRQRTAAQRRDALSHPAAGTI